MGNSCERETQITRLHLTPGASTMSKHNVNPDHYKVAGRERQGENVVAEVERREVTRLRRQEKQQARGHVPPSQSQPHGPRSEKAQAQSAGHRLRKVDRD
jgi:hypothetical protein